MSVVQSEGVQIISQTCINGLEAAAESNKQLRTDNNSLIGITLFNEVNEYDRTHPKKKYKFKSSQDQLLYKIGCIRTGGTGVIG